MMKIVKTTKIAKYEKKTSRAMLERFADRLIYFRGRGPGGRSAAVPWDLLSVDEKRKYHRLVDEIDEKLVISQTSCKNISNLVNIKGTDKGKGGNKGRNNNFLYVSNEKSIIKIENSYYVDNAKVGTLLGLKKGRGIHVKAAREEWKFVKIAFNGGDKKYYAVSSLPVAARLKFKLEIEKHYLSQSFKENDDSFYKKASQKNRTTADMRASVIMKWLEYRDNYESKMRADADFEAFWNASNAFKVSVKSLQRWHKNYTSHGIDGLVPRYQRAAAHHTAHWTLEAQKMMEDLYLDDARRTIFNCYQIVLKKCQIEGWFMPSYSTVKRYLDGLPRDLVRRLRYGHKSFVDQSFPSILRDRDAIDAGEIYVCDARMADISYGDGRSGQRLHCFVWVDFATTKVMGVTYSDNGNDVNAVLSSFYLACFEHLPAGAYLDNGVDMVAAAKTTKKTAELPEKLRAPLEHLLGHDNVRFARIHNPQTKIIERKPFGDMARLCDKSFPGYTSASIMDRGEKWVFEQKKGEFLEVDDVKRLISYWFFEKYNNWAPSGESPNEKWDKFFKANKKRRVDSEKLRHLLLPLANHRGQYLYKVGRNGIEYTPAGYKKAKWYWTDWLQTLPQNSKVYVKAHPNEPEHIWIYAQDGKALGEIPLLKWQGVHPIRGGKKVHEYYKARGHREKEILAYKEKLATQHKTDLTVAAKMDRADMHQPPDYDIDPETGEIIEDTKEVNIDYDIPRSTASLQAEMEELRQQKTALEGKIKRLAKSKKERPKKRDDEFFDKLDRLTGSG